MARHRKKVLDDKLDELAKLFDDGQLLMATFPEDFIQKVIDEVTALRAGESPSSKTQVSINGTDIIIRVPRRLLVELVGAADLVLDALDDGVTEYVLTDGEKEIIEVFKTISNMRFKE